MGKEMVVVFLQEKIRRCLSVRTGIVVFGSLTVIWRRNFAFNRNMSKILWPSVDIHAIRP